MTASRPRTVPLRPLGVAEVLDGAVRLVRTNARAAFAVAVPYAIVRTVLTALVQLATLDAGNTFVPQQLTLLAVTGLFGTVRTGALAPVFAAGAVGQRLGLRDALTRLAPRIGALIVLASIVMLGESAGVVALGVGGAWLWGVWAVAAPALVVERVGPMQALGRSFALVRGSFWRVWGVRTLGWLMTYVLSTVATLPFAALAALLTRTDPLRVATEGISQPTLYVLVLSIGTLLAATFVSPISSAVDVLIYTDLRVRREGMDIVMSLPRPPAPPAPPATPAPAVAAW